MAFLVNIEGIDGSGKGTQAGLLQERLEQAGSIVQLFSFPRYAETIFGKAVGEFLNGRFGSLESVDPLLVSLLYAGDRYESRDVLMQAMRDCDFVILDRYVASNVAHQTCKRTGAQQRELKDWIEQIEYTVYHMPKPDLVLLLDLPAEQAQELIARKTPRDYTQSAADIQEADSGYLRSVREVYLRLAADERRWQVIDCIGAGEIRPIAEIAEEIGRIVDETHRAAS